MRFRLIPRALSPVLAAAGSYLGAAAAWAQAGLAGGVCPPGEVCDAAARWGGWAMISLGLIFFAVWLMPARLGGEEEEQTGWITRLPLLRVLQKRMDKELSGWRRLQWPILGLFFTALGIATLAGWR